MTEGVGRSGYYVVGVDGARRALLAGPYPTEAAAGLEVDRVRAMFIRVQARGARCTYEVAFLEQRPGRAMPRGLLNDMVGVPELPEAIEVEAPEARPELAPEMYRRDENGVPVVPHVGARFLHVREVGEDGEPLECRVTRLAPGRAWWRIGISDHSSGRPARGSWEELGRAVKVWTVHPHMRSGPAARPPGRTLAETRQVLRRFRDRP